MNTHVSSFMGIMPDTPRVKLAKRCRYPAMNEWAESVLSVRKRTFGYPCNQNIELEKFYEWYFANNLESVCINNVGDPCAVVSVIPSTHAFECDVLNFFAPLFGFDIEDMWGMVTCSGTDSNNTGIYFGNNYLSRLTGQRPICYVSDEAHYSNVRLAHLQNLDTRVIKTDSHGMMLPDELEKQLDTTRPCLMVYAMGSTFKGAIDDMPVLNAVLARYPQMPVYRHVDAALFGGYLPFTVHRDLLDRTKIPYESIAVSGHKFFGVDEPSGFFLTTRSIYDSQSQHKVPYLNAEMRMINCSRPYLGALKLWWMIHEVGYDRWYEQASGILEHTEYMAHRLDEIDYPHFVNRYSNTVVFRRPSDTIVQKYALACGYDKRFGGALSHGVVMQHVDKAFIDRFVEDLQNQ